MKTERIYFDEVTVSASGVNKAYDDISFVCESDDTRYEFRLSPNSYKEIKQGLKLLEDVLDED